MKKILLELRNSSGPRLCTLLVRAARGRRRASTSGHLNAFFSQDFVAYRLAEPCGSTPYSNQHSAEMPILGLLSERFGITPD